ncbi:MAG: hypothetical protein R2728_01425 [Chitinophagales bacterium]
MSIKSAWKGILFFCFLFGFTNGFAQFNGKHTYIAKLKEEVGVVDIKVEIMFCFPFVQMMSLFMILLANRHGCPTENLGRLMKRW